MAPCSSPQRTAHWVDNRPVPGNRPRPTRSMPPYPIPERPGEALLFHGGDSWRFAVPEHTRHEVAVYADYRLGHRHFRLQTIQADQSAQTYDVDRDKWYTEKEFVEEYPKLVCRYRIYPCTCEVEKNAEERDITDEDGLPDLEAIRRRIEAVRRARA